MLYKKSLLLGESLVIASRAYWTFCDEKMSVLQFLGYIQLEINCNAQIFIHPWDEFYKNRVAHHRRGVHFEKVKDVILKFFSVMRVG